MNKIRPYLMAAVLAGLTPGCASNVKQLGVVGNTTFYRVKSSTFSGPNFSALVTKDAEGNAHIEQAFGGPGLGATTISAIGQVGASAVLGRSFPKNVGDNISASGGDSGALSASSSMSAATGGNANATGGAGGTGTGTGGTGIGGAGGAGTGTGGAGKSHPDSPGNGGIPGNGGQNKP